MKKRFLETFNSVSNKTKSKIVCVTTVATTAIAYATPVFAADLSVLNADVQTALTTGFSNVTTIITAIVVLAIPTSIGIISLVGGAKTGLKWIKGAISKAS